MLEVYVTEGQYTGQWCGVYSFEEAVREFGTGFDRSSIRERRPKTVEFVAIGREVVQCFDDGREVLACIADTEDAAERQAQRFNQTHPDMKVEP